ncbi:MAG: lytic transglycosylase domain-containing protein [Chloroflexi bacterium]|nr:lytic transglycosylase domain-containing protein [Chloroflexota bacterium]
MQARRLTLACFSLVAIIAFAFHYPARAQSGDSASESILSPYWSSAVTQWESIISQEAQRRSLDPDLVAALIWKESRGRATAQGPAGAVGLMMVMPFPWRPSPEELADPWTNLFWGARALAHTIRDGNGDLYYSLAAYNGSWEQIHLRVTRRYAASILDEYTRAIAVRHGLPADGEWLALFAVEGAPGPQTIIVLGPQRPLARYTERPWGQADIPMVPAGLSPHATAITFEDEQGMECRVDVWLIAKDAPSFMPYAVQSIFFPPSTGYGNRVRPTPTPRVQPTSPPPTQSPAPTDEPIPTPTPTLTLTPTLTPTLTSTPPATATITLTPTIPADCEGGPLWLETWYLDRVYTADGWTATIFIEGHGGDCVYTYAWEGEIKGGPMLGPITFEISHTDRSAIIMGTASVTSAGETVEKSLFIKPPGDD